jgi:hypothetical protein
VNYDFSSFLFTDECCSDRSVPAPSKHEDTQDAELARAIEKSKSEVSSPNSDSIALDRDMIDAPAAQETEEPAATDAKPADEAPAGNDQKPAEPAEPDEPEKLSEPPVEVPGGEDLPSVENGAPEKSDGSNDTQKAEANGVASGETKEDEPTTKATNGDIAVEDHAPDHDTPSSILEKGTRDTL